MIIQLKQYPELKAFIKTALPHYRKHKAIVLFAEQYEVTPSHWDGGSIDYHATADYPSGGDSKAESVPFNFLGKYETRTIPITPNRCVFSYGTFRGKEACIAIYLHPSLRSQFADTQKTGGIS